MTGRLGEIWVDLSKSGNVFWYLLVLAFSVRLALVLGLGVYHEPMRGELHKTAMSLATVGVYGDPYCLPTGPTAHSSPLYTFVAAAVFLFFGTGVPGELALNIVNIALASLVYALLPAMAAELGLGRFIGFSAGLFGATVPFHYLNDSRQGGAALGALALMAILSLAVRTFNAPRFQTRLALLSGLVWGLSLLLLPALLPVGLGLAALGVVLVRRRWLAAHLAVVATVAFLLLLPWSLRNQAVLGSAIWFRSNFGIELRLAHNDMAQPDIDRNRVGGSFDRFHPFVSPEAAEAVQREGEVAYNRRLRRDALDWIAANPFDAARLTALRALYFWFPHTLKPAQTLLLSTLSVAGVVGLLLMYRRGVPAAKVLLIVWTTFPLVYYLLQSAVRYRYPMNWTLLLAAVFAVGALSEAHRARKAP